jgi:hypothetical protein
LQEVTFGSWPVAVTVGDAEMAAGSPIRWTPDQVHSGSIRYVDATGADAEMTWAVAGMNPGWCKLDWVVADPDHGGVSNASNVVDATWEAPDGVVVPLDGFLDPYFQEVYLEADSLPLFTKLVAEMGADSVAEYVERLTAEVYKYTVTSPNHGKAARRMYNIFRLTGRYAEAAYIRELFDEPVTALYQVAALLRSLHEAADGTDTFQTDGMVDQVDQLIMSAVIALEGRSEVEMVRRLLRLRDAIATRAEAASFTEDVTQARHDAMAAVDAYFRKVLTALPTIAQYLDDVAAGGDSA